MSVTYLKDVVKSLCSELHIERITREQYERALSRFGQFLGRLPTVADLTIEQVNGFLLWLPGEYKLGPTSIRNYRTSLIRIWNFASHPLDLLAACPTTRIRLPKKPEKPVVAWTLEQYAQLLTAAVSLPGCVKSVSIPSCAFVTALIRIAYETGLRPSDLRRLRWDQVDMRQGMVILAQNKTGRLHTALIGPETIVALKLLQRYNYERVFPLDKAGVHYWERKLYQAAARHGFTRAKRQGVGTLRKTHATEIFKSFGLDAAAQSLGHYGDRSTARNHYIDSSTRKGYLPPSPDGPSQKRA